MAEVAVMERGELLRGIQTGGKIRGSMESSLYMTINCSLSSKPFPVSHIPILLVMRLEWAEYHQAQAHLAEEEV